MPELAVNKAAWLPSEKASAMEVGPGPEHVPAENEVVIKVAYAAVNPVDWKMQDSPYFSLPYPFILGTDVAGTIVKLGPGVTRFSVGQRVLAHCDSLLVQHAYRSGFQSYTVCREILVAPVPDSMPLANAAVLPISIDTAATGLFKHLKLPLPSIDPKPTGKTILIWGGSSSVGSSAIQLAVAAGYTVVTIAGAKNHAYVTSLGATFAFDYNDPNVVATALKVLKSGDVVFDAIGETSAQKACADIVHKLGGGKLATSSGPLPTGYDDVEVVFINCLDPGLVDLDIGNAVWRQYLPWALEAGKFLAKPDPLVIEGGLQKVQEGINLLRMGVSAQKVVIEIAKED